MNDFQSRVDDWLQACFGPEIAADTIERNHRFLEEALELVQSCDCTRSEAHQLVDYVFDRDVGEKAQELGGVMVTLAALANAQKLSIVEAQETELARVWTKVEKIRAKQAAKPKHSPLPEGKQMTDLVKRMRRVGYADVANHIEKIEADLCKSQEALDTIMNSNMVEALEAESDEFERTVMKLELAEDRIEALEAALGELVTACERQFIDNTFYSNELNVCFNQPDNHGVTFGHIRRARKVLEKKVLK